jgi:3-deoxy-D-manno-octulosonic-acid transferase
VSRFLDHWRPDLAVWVESELWPNLVLMTHRRGIPMLLLNGRLSARSHARWRIWGALAQPMLGAFALCLAQDEVQAGRFAELGARKVASVGDLKSAASARCAGRSAFARYGLPPARMKARTRSRWRCTDASSMTIRGC